MILTNAAILTFITAFNWAFDTTTLKNGTTKTDPAIVKVMTPTGHGTGFFIEVAGQNYVVTAAHVCGDNPLLISAKGIHKVLAVRYEKDLCIATTFQTVSTLKLGEDVKSGDFVDMTGFPGNLIYDYQSGTAEDVGPSMFMFPLGYYPSEGPCPPLAFLNSAQDGCGVFVTTISIKILARPGNSGGPVQNAAGEVVGILIGTDNNGRGAMTPVSELKGMLEGRP
jgi:V8-like Glu-specific endopeptidase